MTTVFWDQWTGGLYATSNNDQLSCLLRNSTEAPKSKAKSMVSKGVLLLHDNARSRTSRKIRELIESFGWEVLKHAPYSPDLAPNDWSTFSSTSNVFSDNEEVKVVVNSWLSNQAADFFEEGFQNLVLRYDKYINKLGNYVEK
ncbi:mariner Mos1 transposase [Trichonephila clavipes]|nr:mariner Mos1 transposase [Trichonephila clavipes]